MYGMFAVPQNAADRFGVTLARESTAGTNYSPVSEQKNLFDESKTVLIKPCSFAVLFQADKNSQHMQVVQRALWATLACGLVDESLGLADGSPRRKKPLEWYYQITKGSSDGMRV